MLYFFLGIILSFIFAPFNYWLFSYVVLVPLIYKIITFDYHDVNKKKTIYYAKSGLAFGMGFFGFSVYWVFTSIHVYGYTNIFVAGFLTALFVFILALFFAVQFACMGYFLETTTLLPKTINFSILWVIFEWLRSFLFSGFPWCYLGTSHIDTILAGYIPIIGVHGVSFLILLGASSIAITIKNRNFIFLVFMLIIYICGYLLQDKEWVQVKPHAYKVSMIQGNIAPDHKFALTEPISIFWQAYGAPTLQITKTDLLIWPENSIPYPPEYLPEIIEPIEKHTKKNNITWLFGGPAKYNGHYYVGLFMRDKKSAIYYKQHLVPFGEYVPLENILRHTINVFNLPMSDFHSGSKEQASLISGKLNILPIICYEIAFPWLVQQSLLKNNSEIIVNISEDGWFGKSIGPHQHLQMARMRALENGRYLLRSTTSGISAIIDHKGNIVKQTAQFVPATLQGEFFAISGTTPWTRFGNKTILFIIIGGLFLGRILKYL